MNRAARPTRPAAADIARRRHWLFDMDGTLTRAMHDFDAMRERLGLPPGRPILEALAELDAASARAKRRELDAMELEMAARATPQPGAAALLERLAARGATLSIVTRNGADIAAATLDACGLARFFAPASVVGRDCCEPKPHPAGVRLALERVGGRAEDAVIVGDYRFDLEAGRGAGVATVHLDVDGGETWPDATDLRVGSLASLAALLDACAPPDAPPPRAPFV